ncbi:bactofilin family protein [Aquisalibacillus elongatus]|uniref:Cytoskeletal protein CcmA (Bactofilin family) n=1 Tax=Aquisalibacillus elongatus TaxID=485577 RepID=A0A3N5B1Y2_9BACI|nr:polymer-forming cytoskeletal protein [Aquisalibacillus elongatus]RPF51149.1 cytoskeletal protein CcmA (bactofilin family) [Aquisalibacillus elongatus]
MRSKQEKQLNNVDTIIGSGTTIKGDLESEASIRVDGTVSGTVACQGDVEIGQEGKIEAEVKGRNVIVAGTVKGNVTSQDMLKVESSGKLHGDASMSTLVIDEGGQFDGRSSMGQQESNESSNKKNDNQNKKKDKQNKKEQAS